MNGALSTRKPKLLVLTSTLPRWENDTEPRFVLDLARALADRFDPIILAPMAVGAARKETLDGINVERFAYAPRENWQVLATPGAIMPNLRKYRMLWLLVPMLLIAQFFAIVRTIRRERFDVVHCHWIVPQGLMVAVASLFMRMPPIVMTCHGADAFTLEFAFMSYLKRWVLSRADIITVVSREIRDHLACILKREMTHIPMGVNLDRFVMRQSVVAPEAPIILFAGRLAAKKGVAGLIRVIANPKLAERNAHLRIVGDGPLRKELEELALSLNIGPRVSFVGSVSHEALALEMHGATLFCAPFIIASDGDREGTPTVLLEAAASRIPVITSDVGGCGDIIRSGRSGWLLKPGDETALAEALIEALDNPINAHALATEARKKAEEYAWPNVADRFSALFHSVSKTGKHTA